MALVIALYVAVLAVSVGFFLWAAVWFFQARRRTRASLRDVIVGPESNPRVVALYAQFLLAPELALKEARALCAAADSGSLSFFEALRRLQVEQASPVAKKASSPP